MDSLSSSAKLRLKNLRALHGRAGGFGAPTSDYLVSFLNKSGMSLSNTDLTHIYQGTKPISDSRAKDIEKAFGLSPGWLSEDHEFLYKLAPAEIAAHAKLSALPPGIKEHLYSLVEALAPSK